jgi:dienelactone hydrolase
MKLVRIAIAAAAALCVAFAATSAATSPAGGTGKYPAVMLEEQSLAEHTVYRPESLAPFGRGRRLPVVVWGNGGCATTGNSSAEFLSEIASHGYLVIASGPIRALPAAAAAPAGTPAAGAPAVPPAPRPALSRTAQLFDAIAWAEAQATQQGGQYAGKIDARRVAVMGTSCGGLQAIEASVDPRISTTLIWSSGLLDQPREGANATVDHLKRMHGPVLYVSGGTDDMATKPSYADFARIDGVPVFHGDNAGAGHGGPFKQPHGGNWAPVGVAWLDWQLKGDRQAARLFKGADCGLCVDPAWKVEKKRID